MSAVLSFFQPDQREAAGEQLTVRRPMVDLGAAMAMLDFNDEQLRRAIDRGRIKWAFNLGVGGRKHLQILVRSLATFCDRTIIQPATVEGVANMVLPAESSASNVVKGTELQFALNIRSQHVMRLLDAGLIAEAEESEVRTGPSGSPSITRASVVRLLAARRVK